MSSFLNNIKHGWFMGIAITLCFCAGPAAAQVASNTTAAAAIDYFQPAVFRELPDGEDLLDKVRQRLPAVPLMLRADIKTLAKGEPDYLLKAEVEMHWDTPEPTTRYTIMDSFGSLVERLDVTWSPGGPSRYLHYTGEAEHADASFDLYTRIQSAQLTWFDISMAFLWWPGGETAGVDRRKSRDCYLVDIPTPTWEKAPYRRIRVWVDAKEFLILHAEAYGLENELVKTIKIQSIKKINEVWMIKDLEVDYAPTQVRTKILVQDLDLLARARIAEPSADEETIPPVLPDP